MNKPLLLGCSVAVLSATGCATDYHYTKTTNTAVSEKDPSCAVELFLSSPDRPYDELGVLSLFMGSRSTDSKQFLYLVRERVCRAGGDAVVAKVNGQGEFMRATVIRFRE